MAWFKSNSRSVTTDSSLEPELSGPANDGGLAPCQPMVIQAMRFEPGRPVFGRITRSHLALFQIPLDAFEPLYEGWLRLMQVHDETGTVSSVWTDGEALHVALQPTFDDLKLITCMRWSLMMSTIGLHAVIERDVRDG